MKERPDVKAVSRQTVLWFGTGSMTAEILPAVDREKLRIAAFIDERPERRGTIFAGAPVIGLEDIPGRNFDCLLLAARPYGIIAGRLRRVGVPEEKIVSLDFENALNPPTFKNIQDHVLAVLGQYPGLTEGFNLPELMRSSWFITSGMADDRKIANSDARFFNEMRLADAEDLLESLARPLPMPDMPGRCTSMQIETSALCEYRCFCCASHRATRRKGIMPLEDLRLLTRRVGPYSGRAALIHGGEPFLDAQLPEKIALLRSVWPEAELSFVSTLGVPVDQDWMESLWRNGLDDMEVSFYGYDRETYKNLHGKDRFEVAGQNLSRLLDSPARKAADGAVRIRMLHMEESGRVDSAIYASLAARFREEAASHAGVRIDDTYLSSQSGLGPIQRRRATALPCGVAWGLFRDRINVTWDMNVVPCCQDFDNHIVLGNLRHTSVEEIFGGPVYRDFIRAHWSGDLSAWPLCRGCERSVIGTREQLIRIAVWKIANLLRASPKQERTSFAVIGEESLAVPVEEFFLRDFPGCRRVSPDGANIPAEVEFVFIIARDRAQLAYYRRVQGGGNGCVVIPVLGVGYHVDSSVAEELAEIYGTPHFLEART
ncbi:MAG: SPASM domain-containing protein [Desulfovibrio sp.]|jgi:hypothetical protein|nr:SPASM domain-containing protein [Desulfovibrio sp.]